MSNSNDDATNGSPRLIVQQGNTAPRSEYLNIGIPNTIGRAAECEIRIIDEHCSRRHCVLQPEGQQWFLIDLGSRNGTVVNGQKSHRHCLREGDVISIGQTCLMFTQSAEDAELVGTALDHRAEGDHRDQTPMLRGGRDALPAGRPGYSDPNDYRQQPFVAAEETAHVDRTSSFGTRWRDDDQLIGDSHAMQAVRKQIENVALSDATVLIRGESGVGKELVAQAIHRESRRRRGPFVCVNCAALSEALLESEIFGHERGALGSGTEMRRGKLEQAHRGTFVLDEVGELGLTLQARILRVLEGHSYERLGGQAPVQADIRIVATTNTDLEAAVRDGRFRRDLYYRLNVLPLELPPLRVRKSDIPALARHFLDASSERSGMPSVQLTPGAVEKLKSHDWPGNVRELRNTLERCIVMSNSNTIDEVLIDFEGPAAAAVDESRYEGLSLEAVEIQHIIRTLKQTRWNKSKAAAILGIERSTLDRKLKRHDVVRND